MSRSNPLVIGVTGNIASGKSTVMGRLADHGAATIDADHVYHALIEPGAALWQKLRQTFGESIVAADGAIDRDVLGTIVFSDPTALADLDELTHPTVVAEILRRIHCSDATVVAVDAVKLFESRLSASCDHVWIVTSNPAQQVSRLVSRNHLSLEDAQRRVDTQPPLEPRLHHADVIIDNSGSIQATCDQVDAAWRTLPIAPCN